MLNYIMQSNHNFKNSLPPVGRQPTGKTSTS